MFKLEFQILEINLITHVSNRLSASMASWTMVGCEAWHAVNSSIVLVELSAIYRLVACVTGEVFWVPLLVQGCYYLWKIGL